MEKPSVTVIVLNWNGKDLTIDCLESLQRVNYLNFNILVVDNGSTDGSVELLKEKFPEVSILVLEKTWDMPVEITADSIRLNMISPNM